jgi:hypothetical protein
MEGLLKCNGGGGRGVVLGLHDSTGRLGDPKSASVAGFRSVCGSPATTVVTFTVSVVKFGQAA